MGTTRKRRTVASCHIEFPVPSGAIVAATSEDVSATGLYVRTPTCPEKGAVIPLLITLPDDSSVRLTVRVAHVKKTRPPSSTPCTIWLP